MKKNINEYSRRVVILQIEIEIYLILELKRHSLPLLNELVRKLPFNASVITETGKDNITKTYIKIILSIQELPFSAWFDVDKNDMFSALDSTNPFVRIKTRSYLKTYSVLVNNPKNEHERQYGRRYFDINKQLYPDGLCYYVKTVYPRPKFLKTMYKVNFTNLSWVSNTIIGEIRNINDKLNSQMIDIFYNMEDNGLAAIVILSNTFIEDFNPSS